MTPWYRRWAWVVFVFFAVLVVLFGVFPGTWFAGGDLSRETQWLVTTYAAATAVFGLAIALTGFRRGERWVWLALWFWPVFFVVHGIVFFPVDFVFAALAVVALALTRPTATRS